MDSVETWKVLTFGNVSTMRHVTDIIIKTMSSHAHIVAALLDFGLFKNFQTRLAIFSQAVRFLTTRFVPFCTAEFCFNAKLTR